MAAPGRDQGSAMERLLRLAIYLTEHPRYGVPGAKLAQVAGYDADNNGMGALGRDLRRLREAGWDIVNTGPDGQNATYKIIPGDNRLAVMLTAGEREALQHALDQQGRQLAATPRSLDLIERAAERHCLVRFTYHGKPRVVHPYTLHTGPSGWVLRGREDGSEITKSFVVTRMDDDVEIDGPGSAEVVTTVPHRGFDPMTWEVDPPVEVVLATTPEHSPAVLNAMIGGVEQAGEDGQLLITVPVTHRAAFRDRLYALGGRVRVVGPPEVRAEIIDDLQRHLEAVS